MKTIETKEDFLKWANDCNKVLKPQEICDLQDVYGHSEVKTIKDLFVNDDSTDNRMIAFAINKVMGWDALKEMINHLIRAKANKIINEEIEHYMADYLKRDKALSEKEQAFRESRKPYWKRITKLMYEIGRMESVCNHYRKQNEELESANRKLRNDLKQAHMNAFKFEKIKELLLAQ